MTTVETQLQRFKGTVHIKNEKKNSQKITANLTATRSDDNPFKFALIPKGASRPRSSWP